MNEHVFASERGIERFISYIFTRDFSIIIYTMWNQ
jgi:hypothetical protein